MNILLDTNILLFITKTKEFSPIANFINPDKRLTFVSIVSEAEISSFAIKNHWGTKRIEYLNLFLNSCNIIDVNKSFVSIYAHIDSYSQCQNPNFHSYPFKTPRNMGKNDLWIASLAAMLNLQLVTTDADFDHLHNVFFEVRKIQPEEFVAFF